MKNALALAVLVLFSCGTSVAEAEGAQKATGEAALAEQSTAQEQQPETGAQTSVEQDAAATAEADGEEDAAQRPEPGPQEKQLIASIKMLFAAQDAVAAGHDDAKALQGYILAQISGKRYGEGAMSGSDHLAHYLAGYLLSGGDTLLVDALLVSSKFGEASANLLNGCILYRKGKREDALKSLDGVDLASLPAAILGRVTLARAVITPDKQARERLLAISIASMPGTLVEEGALRRSALGFSEAGDRINFWRRVDRYTRRFPHSSYLPDFIQQVATVAAKMAQERKSVGSFELDQSLSRLTGSERMKVYITLARLASSRHSTELIDFAASRLGRIAEPGGAEAQIASLYRNAYRLLEKDDVAPRSELKEINQAILPEPEAQLLKAALAIAEEIDAPPEPAAGILPPAKNPLVDRAEAALKSADKLLQEPL